MPRTARHQERISPQSKRKVERAVAAVMLTASEWARFERLLLDPPKPNARLKRAFAEHARIVRR